MANEGGSPILDLDLNHDLDQSGQAPLGGKGESDQLSVNSNQFSNQFSEIDPLSAHGKTPLGEKAEMGASEIPESASEFVSQDAGGEGYIRNEKSSGTSDQLSVNSNQSPATEPLAKDAATGEGEILDPDHALDLDQSGKATPSSKAPPCAGGKTAKQDKSKIMSMIKSKKERGVEGEGQSSEADTSLANIFAMMDAATGYGPTGRSGAGSGRRAEDRGQMLIKSDQLSVNSNQSSPSGTRDQLSVNSD